LIAGVAPRRFEQTMAHLKAQPSLYTRNKNNENRRGQILKTINNLCSGIVLFYENICPLVAGLAPRQV